MQAFASTVVEAAQILEAVLAAAAQALKLTPDQLQVSLRLKGSRELEELVQRVTDRETSDVAAVFRWVTECILARCPIDSVSFVEAIREGHFCSEPWEMLGRLLALVPSTRLPGVLIEADRGALGDERDAAEQLAVLARQVATVAMLFPRVPLAVGISADDFLCLSAEIPDCLAKALVRESVIRLAAGFPETPDEGASGHSQIVSHDSFDSGRLESVATASDGEVGTAVLEAMQRTHDLARSEAERFLYKLLNEDSQLQGMFALNVTPGIPFGKSEMEIDLACVELRIAIEVDGFWHFTTADRYRTDRRKDLELQRNGYLILRVLAEDVVPRMQEIRDRVRDVVAFRRRTDG